MANLSRRLKISHDPNNTAWSRSSTKYGQRILESHGWAPGDFLGVRDGPHGKLQSAASASPVKIAVKDDNLGLGAKRGAGDENGKTMGLDVFQDLLSRLNGKTEKEVENVQWERSNMRRSVFVEQRWGRLGFVSGGFLVGDRLQDLSKKQAVVNVLSKEKVKEPKDAATDGQKTKQRKSLRLPHESKPEGARKVRDKSSERSLTTFQLARETFTPQDPSLERDRAAQDIARAMRKAEKAERKLERKARREARRKLRDEKSQSQTASPLTDSIHHERESPVKEYMPSHFATESTIPSRTIVAIGGGRNAVRRRYIQHTKMAMRDSKALNEVGR